MDAGDSLAAAGATAGAEMAGSLGMERNALQESVRTPSITTAAATVVCVPWKMVLVEV